MKKLLLLSLAILFGTTINAQWSPLSTGLGGFLVSGQCFTTYNNKLIVGGNFSAAGGNNIDNIAAWDGSNWSLLGTGLQSTVTATKKGVTSLALYNSDLYAGGSFYASGTTTLIKIAKWNGSAWSSVASSVRDTIWAQEAHIDALCSFNGELYAGGTFNKINNIKANHIAKWNGTTWSPLGAGLKGDFGMGYIEGVVNAITVYNNEIYAAGHFTLAGTVPAINIAKWNGSVWSAVGTGIPSSSLGYGVTSLLVHNNELYAGNRVSGISKWNGTSWLSVGGGLVIGGTGGAYAMTVHNNKLIVGGDFTSAGTLTSCFHISAWDGISWNHIAANGPSGFTGAAYGVYSYNGCLYATGKFISALGGSVNLNYIASYCGVVSIKENLLFNQVSISPNPSTGQFTFDGLTENFSIEITDLAGRIIYTGQLDESKNKINLQDKNSGVYFYKIKNKENKVQQGKLILN